MTHLAKKFKTSVVTIAIAAVASWTFNAQAIVPEPAAKQSKAIAITGVTAHIGNGEVIEQATITFDQGKITYIGRSSSQPDLADHQVVALPGKHLYPGFILPNTQMGLVEVNAVKATRDQGEKTQLNPSVRSITSYNTDSELIPTLRFNGILTAQVKPSGGLISGLSSLVALDGWNWEDAAYATDTAMHLNWPDVYSSRFDYASFSKITKKNKHYKKQEQQLEEIFQAAALYNTKKNKAKKSSKHYAKSAPNLKLAALKRVLTGDVQLLIHTNGAREIINSVKFAKRHGVNKIVIVGASEALLVADFLKQENIPVILAGVHSLPTNDDDDIDQAFKLPAQLINAGIKVAIGSSSTIQPQGARNLAFGAGTTAAYGLSKEQALSLITKNVAEILGVGDSLGTLTVGKDATLFVSQGDALDMRGNQLVKAYIQGKDLDLVGTQQQLYQRYKKKYAE